MVPAESANLASSHHFEFYRKCVRVLSCFYYTRNTVVSTPHPPPRRAEYRGLCCLRHSETRGITVEPALGANLPTPLYIDSLEKYIVAQLVIITLLLWNLKISVMMSQQLCNVFAESRPHLQTICDYSTPQYHLTLTIISPK